MSALLVLSSGHNLPPEPLESELARLLLEELGPGHEELLVCVVGHGRPHAAALIAFPGELSEASLRAAVETLNADLPPKARLYRHLHVAEAWTAEEGQLTTNLKLRRREIDARYAEGIAALYEREAAAPKSPAPAGA